jgi:hypothetical protein
MGLRHEALIDTEFHPARRDTFRHTLGGTALSPVRGVFFLSLLALFLFFTLSLSALDSQAQIAAGHFGFGQKTSDLNEYRLGSPFRGSPFSSRSAAPQWKTTGSSQTASFLAPNLTAQQRYQLAMNSYRSALSTRRSQQRLFQIPAFPTRQDSTEISSAGQRPAPSRGIALTPNDSDSLGQHSAEQPLSGYEQFSRKASLAAAQAIRGIYQHLFAPSVAVADDETSEPASLEEIEHYVKWHYRRPADSLDHF